MSLQRKKVKVRAKSGKVYQRSMLVKSDKGGTRRAGKLHSLNPWEARHTEHVSTNSVLPADRAKLYGSSGPGSDHSWTALRVGAIRDHYAWSADRTTKRAAGTVKRILNPVAGESHAVSRREVGRSAARDYVMGTEVYGMSHADRELNSTVAHTRLGDTFGASHVRRIPQNPNKWVR